MNRRNTFLILKIIFSISIVFCVILFYKSCEKPYTFNSCISGGYKYNGTYYYTTNTGRDKSIYIILTNDEWEDSDGLYGTYNVTSKGVIIFYLRNSSEEFVRGTIGNGVLEIDLLLTTVRYTTEK